MRLGAYISAFFVMLLAYSIGFADISIHIEKGVDRPYPIAIIPFSGGSQSSEVTGIIEKDLINSGRFDLLAKAKMPQKVSNVKELNLSQWSKSGVEFVVLGQVERQQDGRYDVSFYLISQLGGRSLIAKAFKNIPQSQLRALSHHVSDLIYQGITGIKGYFSTKLTYVEVLNPYSQKKAIYKLIVSDYDGYNPQVLLRQTAIPIASPTWSPDGNYIAYVSYINGRMAIYRISVITGKRQLISNLEGINSAPAFGPDDTVMALALSKGTSYYTNIYLFNLKKHNLERLTSTGINTSPAFSPDGQSLIFTSNRSGLPQIYQLQIGESYPKRLTFNGVQNMDAHFTPNGKTIVFMHQAKRGGDLNIAKQSITNGDITILTDGNVDKSPSVSPNGQMIVYTRSLNNGKVNLAMVSLDGQVHLDLPATKGNVQSPSWSPYL
ncbi:Tol-Pal system beta propeller repeat protein TolB [Thiotrichales bacterium 19S3-7]|nr:Tol-Pal system beta propeller repeat protein TolB [Thiotrichales bacterium 19S3-7]MCF6802759.1 Tol-Pal system beta propeller repeat protein TolB [Thiotrichales bacterium 19S3-11]